MDANGLSRVGVDVARVAEIAAGQSLVDTVKLRLSEVDEMWVVHSAASKQSPNVALEIDLALASQIPITFMLVDDTAPPADTSRARVFDVRSGSLRRLESRLLGAVGRGAPRTTLAEDDVERRGGPRVLRAGVQTPRLASTYPSPLFSPLAAVARPRLMAALEDAVLHDDAGGKFVALLGRAASGKTHLAAPFVAEHEWRFRDVAWLGASDLADAVPAITQRTFEVFGASDPREPPPPDEPGRRVLVVVDDVTSADELRAVNDLPAQTDVLAISRIGLQLGDVVHRPFAAVVVEATIGEAEALEYALRRYPALGTDEVTRIIEATKRDALLLPVLLEAAATWSDGDALEVFDALRRSAGQEAGHYFLDTDDPRLITEWERSFARLSEEGTEVELADFEPGSWRRKWQRRYSPERAEQVLDNLERAAEIAALGRPESDATATTPKRSHASSRHLPRFQISSSCRARSC